METQLNRWWCFRWDNATITDDLVAGVTYSLTSLAPFPFFRGCDSRSTLETSGELFRSFCVNVISVSLVPWRQFKRQRGRFAPICSRFYGWLLHFWSRLSENVFKPVRMPPAELLPSSNWTQRIWRGSLCSGILMVCPSHLWCVVETVSTLVEFARPHSSSCTTVWSHYEASIRRKQFSWKLFRLFDVAPVQTSTFQTRRDVLTCSLRGTSLFLWCSTDCCSERPCLASPQTLLRQG